MAESAALLVDEVFAEQPVRQWVLSVPYPLRFLFASCPEIMGRVLSSFRQVDDRYQHEPVTVQVSCGSLFGSDCGHSVPSWVRSTPANCSPSATDSK